MNVVSCVGTEPPSCSTATIATSTMAVISRVPSVSYAKLLEPYARFELNAVIDITWLSSAFSLKVTLPIQSVALSSCRIGPVPGPVRGTSLTR